MRRSFRAAPRALLATAAAVAAVELLLRLILSHEMVFGLWFSRGLHTPNEECGFVLTPRYRGVMYHPDKVQHVPLKLDEHGYRLPADSGARPFELPGGRSSSGTGEGRGPSADVVLLGGASMMFSYGLPDRQTIHSQVARHASIPMRVYNTAWPGFELLRSYHAFRSGLGKDLRPALVVICCYRVPMLPETPESLGEPPPRDHLFRFFDDCVTRPLEGTARALGRHYYATYLVPRLIAAGDSAGRKMRRTGVVLREAGVVLRKLLRAKGGAPAVRQAHDGRVLSPSKGAPGDVAGGSAIDEVDELSRQPEALERYRRLILHLEPQLSARGARVLVVFLPSNRGRRELYVPLRRALPSHIPQLDLHYELIRSLKNEHFIAANHYDAHASALIGRRIAEKSCEILRARPLF